MYSLHAAAYFLTQALFNYCGKLRFVPLNAKLGHFRFHLSAYLFAGNVNKRRKMGKRYALPAVLVGGNLRDYLRCNVARGRKAVRPLYKGAGYNGAVLQHVLKVHKVAVMHMLGKIVRIVEMDNAFVVRFNYFLWQQYAVGNIARNLARHIVALGGIDNGVLVGVFLLCFLVIAFYKAEYFIVRGVGLADERARIAIGNVILGHLKRAVRHNLLFHHVLNLFNAGGAAKLFAA